uniref:Uncharacterized protein n=1 Tax=Bactrocera dorsalis TaxID=27457 RepID=A0A034V4C1_BACDO
MIMINEQCECLTLVKCKTKFAQRLLLIKSAAHQSAHGAERAPVNALVHGAESALVNALLPVADRALANALLHSVERALANALLLGASVSSPTVQHLQVVFAVGAVDGGRDDVTLSTQIALHRFGGSLDDGIVVDARRYGRHIDAAVQHHWRQTVLLRGSGAVVGCGGAETQRFWR